MLTLVIFLMFLLSISITINVISIKLNLKAGGIIRSYEDFYEDTIEDCVEIITYIENLLNGNYMLAEDEDVGRLRKSIKLFYDILVGYLHALPKTREETKKGEEKGR